MKSERSDLSERLLDFYAKVIKLAAALNKTAPGRHVANQLMRSSTSSGANDEEAGGAESKADFIHKMQLVLKELKESLYWLKRLRKSALMADERVEPLLSESQDLVKIIAKSIVTAKSR
jgi:four helix bundle protein